jgi:AbrB family looped-hinge helix DNA binding protein
LTRTKLTEKSQTTVPKHVRQILGIGPGDEVEWFVMGRQVVVDSRNRVEHPIEVFKRHRKRVRIDAVELVRKVREGLR